MIRTIIVEYKHTYIGVIHTIYSYKYVSGRITKNKSVMFNKFNYSFVLYFLGIETLEILYKLRNDVQSLLIKYWRALTIQKYGTDFFALLPIWHRM